MASLIGKGVAQKVSCARYETLQRHVTYRVSLKKSCMGHMASQNVAILFPKPSPIWTDLHTFSTF